MGIHKRNNSKYWYIQFVLDGRTHVKSSKTTNRRLAERMERQWRDELLEQTELGGKKPITVGDALKKFARARRKYASHRVILSNIKHILAAIDGTKFLHEVRKKDVVRLIERLEGEDKSPSTIRNVMNNFRAALNYNDSLGYRTPLLAWPHIKPERKRLRYLTLEEEQRLIGELDSSRKCRGMSPEDSRRAFTQDNQDLVVILLDTGARLNEIQRLEWKQVDLAKRQTHLWRPKVKNESVLYMTDRIYGIFQRRYDERRIPRTTATCEVPGIHRTVLPRPTRNLPANFTETQTLDLEGEFGNLGERWISKFRVENLPSNPGSAIFRI